MAKYSLVHLHFADGTGCTTHVPTAELLSYRAQRMGRANIGVDADERVVTIDSEPLTQDKVAELFKGGHITANHAHNLFALAREV